MASGDDLGSDPDPDPDLAAQVSQRLREAHRQVAALPVADEMRARAMRRLLAVTNAAKRDLPTAARRLDALLADLDAGRYG
ncbi:MAG: hypothetical protein GEV03_06310 [Streptosporangiales bacterium]|nr:hypothetical protein [Streptosporangiales bacterium]